MPLRSALMALLLLPPLFGHGASEHVTHIGAWTVRARTDRFTHGASCEVLRPHVRYERQAVVLQLPRRVDTSAAVYRIDDGPLISVGVDAMELARLGFALHGDDLANPSGGRVIVPARRLVEAQAIRVEARPHGAVYRFEVGGLASALDAAAGLGCAAGAFNN